MDKLKLILCLLLYGQIVISQDLVINEFMASNQSFIFDEDGDDSDWIEIFNNTSSTIDLSNYYLSDKDSNLSLWKFPDITINPHDFLLVFASGKDRNIAGNELHTNFKIKASGEELFLTFEGTIIHQTASVDLPTNHSYGLFPDGGTIFFTFTTPSPAYPNVNNTGSLDEITFTVPGGIYINSIQLQLNNTINTNIIFYTLDGTSPTTSSIMYNGEVLNLTNEMCSNAYIDQIQISPPNLHKPPTINIFKGIVIRAASFNTDEIRISEVITNSYFIKDLGIDHDSLPIVSINAEYADLFDFETGIFVPGVNWNEDNPDWTGNYYKRGRDWERKINVEYYEPFTNDGFNQYCGLRTHGGNSRRFPQKGLRIYARSEYGRSKFNYPVFNDKTLESYKRLVFKPFSSSWSQAGIEDYVSNKIVFDTNADGIASRPIILYINGEYWGVYYLQERIDDHFIETNFGVNRNSVDIMENWEGSISEGENGDFLNLYSFIENNDLSIETNYGVIESWIDIDNFIDYQLFEIFIANYDWPANNMKCWREQKTDAKWRWIFFDGDAGLFTYNYNGFEYALNTTGEGWPTNPKATLFLRKLLENEIFYFKFFNRLEELLNNELSYTITKEYYSNGLSLIDSDLNNQINRFSFPESYGAWYENVNIVNSFLALRSCEIKSQVKDMFNETIYSVNCDENNYLVSDLSTFPNPNNGHFTLTFNSNHSSRGIISFTDIMGRKLHEYQVTIFEGENSFDFQGLDLSKGLVLINVATEKSISATKMLSN
ncbi:MAG: hypothetical protein DRI54_06330 [Bacteroidetes bacterium]|nr:MAG: hypothetical protein DRI54_06330 [Bacteroidota bacterium]